jgi:predicted ATP-dependent endonuclease of OLD family
MQIKRIVVTNFRALSQATISFDNITTLIGENNSGKSAVLAAIALFFSSSPRVERKDFSNENTTDPILVTITFYNLTPSERSQFSANIIDEELTITRSFFSDNSKDNGSFSVDGLVNPDFTQVRNATGKNEKRDIYKILQSRYPELDPVSNADQIDEKLEAWEEANPSKLQRQKVGSFRGFKNVAIGQLRSKCEFIIVHAVRDASDDVADAKRSPVLELLNTIARQTIENKAEFQAFRNEINEKIGNFTDPSKVSALSSISTDLTLLLGKYYSDSSLIATWQPVSCGFWGGCSSPVRA